MTDTLALTGTHSAYLSWVDDSGTSNKLTFDCVVDEQWDEGAEVTEHPVEVGANVGDHVRVKLVECTLTIRSTNEPITSNAFDQATKSKAPIQVPSTPPVKLIQSVSYATWDNQFLIRDLAATVGGFLVGGVLGSPLGPLGNLLPILAADAIFQGKSGTTSVDVDSGLVGSPPAAPITAEVQTWPAAGIDYIAKTHSLLKTLKDSAQIFDVFGSKNVGFGMVIQALSFSRNKDTGTGEDITVGLKELRVVSTQTVIAPIPNLSAGGGAPPVNKGQQNPSDAPPPKQTSVAKQIVNSAGGVGGALGSIGHLFGAP